MEKNQNKIVIQWMSFNSPNHIFFIVISRDTLHNTVLALLATHNKCFILNLYTFVSVENKL